MKKIMFFASTLLLSLSAQAAPAVEDSNYATLQNCMAAAEVSANLGSQLDRYCIDSYLATLPANDS